MPTKVLIVIAHPKPTSFNHAVLAVVKKELEAKNCEVQVRDLYALKFNPLLTVDDFAALHAGNPPKDIAEEQKWITWCNVMIIIHPIWWGSMPAIFKGYIDRVFSAGFAYKVEPTGPKPALTDKSVLILNTHGQPKEIYAPKFYPAINQVTNVGIYEFCGVKVINHHYFGGIPYIPQEMRVQVLKDIEKIMKDLKI